MTMKFPPAMIAFIIVAVPSAALAEGDFTGERLEIRAGWDHARIEDDQYDVRLSESGGTFGIALGHDRALFERVIVGVELAADFNTGKRCGVAGLLPNDEICLDLARTLSASARIGRQLSDATLLYGSVGYANARVRAEYSLAGTRLADGVRNEHGVRFGGGLEWAAWRGAFLKLEYDHAACGDGARQHIVRSAVGMRF